MKDKKIVIIGVIILIILIIGIILIINNSQSVKDKNYYYSNGEDSYGSYVTYPESDDNLESNIIDYNILVDDVRNNEKYYININDKVFQRVVSEKQDDKEERILIYENKTISSENIQKILEIYNNCKVETESLVQENNSIKITYNSLDVYAKTNNDKANLRRIFK